MNVVFFKHYSAFIDEKLRSKDPSYCFFWYSSGLSSYDGLESIIEIDSIFIERALETSFSREYPTLMGRFPHSTFENDPQSTGETGEVAFLASNDTIVYLFSNILKQSNKWKLFTKTRESAKKNADKIGLPCTELDGAVPHYRDYKLLVLGNDWGLQEQKINCDFIYARKNTVCLQESVIDFNIADRRMLYCSLPVYQGLATLKNLDLRNKICAVIGNPRYEELRPTPLPEKSQVMINVNFTYGIHEDARKNWLEDILTSCSELGLDYIISQHPRDASDLSAYNTTRTNAGSVHDIVKDSSVLVTRFSSLIHEALCLGRPVIYYNPHGERLFYDFEPDNKSLIYATSKTELVAALDLFTSSSIQNDLANSTRTYIKRHLGVTHLGKASEYVKILIGAVQQYPPLKTTTFQEKAKLDLQVLKRRIFNQKV
jgi:hypothetical protein